MPDPEEFMHNFNQEYIDKESKQGQDILNYIRDITNDLNIYLTAFFNYCAFGECYTYTELRGDKIIKECVPLMEAYPIPNSEYMIEDHDMFARKMKMSYNQILDALMIISMIMIEHFLINIIMMQLIIQRLFL